MVQFNYPITNNVFDMSQFVTMSHRAIIGWLSTAASKQDKHVFFGADKPDWAPGPVRFREHMSNLERKEECARFKDTQALKELDLERAATLESIHMNAAYIVIMARHKNDDSLLDNTGHDFKDHTKKAYTHTSVSRLPLKVTAKRGDEPGSLVITVERDPGAGVYEVQLCKGVPAGDESYSTYGNYKSVRIFIPGLERAGWYYIRVRSHGNNETSPWSAPVDIIVG
ncbi:fibronectin type III domain-containing protein [Geomonas sp. Red32]|uniref:fibronectin type III domain-containing protein n=1 Tax=Geomonas sp. Red32 TaxID=2912856 RepID=UPI00202CC87E|nr:fibronectin type III domain-containing protein [Geomonas sp. Red32]MCM0080144.1 fibronectin type III domain-containing protein [Geomonas sp. Red32]